MEIDKLVDLNPIRYWRNQRTNNIRGQYHIPKDLKLAINSNPSKIVHFLEKENKKKWRRVSLKESEFMDTKSCCECLQKSENIDKLWPAFQHI